MFLACEWSNGRLRISWSERVTELSVVAIITFLTVFGILCSLGKWQLARAEEKRVIESRSAMAREAAPLGVGDLFGAGELDYRQVMLSGSWSNAQTFLLDNSIRSGVAGYEVLTPLAVDGGWVLVNRGWIARGPIRSVLPEIPPVAGPATVSGYVIHPSKKVFTLREDDFSHPQWPMIIQKIDIRAISSLFSLPLAPVVLRMAPEEGSDMQRDWLIVASRPEKHHGYAMQWFGLAIAWVVIFVVANTTSRKGE
jgi:surfeit locus 1 family protein